MKFNYSARYAPPAPVIECRFAPPQTENWSGPYPALIDTGADITIVPAPYLLALELPEDDTRYLRSQWGERREVTIHTLDIQLGAVRLPAVAIAADQDGTDIILGRNLLNKLTLLLNGPQRMMEIMD